jgi:hypothetical protein
VPFDSLVIDVDSQTIAAWADTTTPGRGGLISLATVGGRVRASDVVLRIDARPTFRPDTVVTVTDRPSNTTFLFDPPLGSSSAQLLVGGRPSWRSYLLFRQGLDTLSVPCPQISAECTIRLADASITFSALQLTPVASPAGYLPQDSMRLTSAFLLASSVAPLERSPLGNGVGVSADFITPSRFEPPAGGSPVEVPVTTFVRSLVGDTVAVEDDDENATTQWLALLPLLEGIDFGMATFAPGPKLRIVLTVARELQLR